MHSSASSVMAPKCQVLGCKNNASKCPNLGFFSIPDPKKEPERCRIWLERLRTDKFQFETYEYSKNHVVCEVHFEANCIENAMSSALGFASKKILKPGSVPTLFSAQTKTDQGSSTQRKQIAPTDIYEDVPSTSWEPLLGQPVPASYYEQWESPHGIAEVTEVTTTLDSPRVLKSPVKRKKPRQMLTYSPKKVLVKSPRKHSPRKHSPRKHSPRKDSPWKEKNKQRVTGGCQTDPPECFDFQQQFPEPEAVTEVLQDLPDHAYVIQSEEEPVKLPSMDEQPKEPSDDDTDSTGSLTTSGSSHYDSSQTYAPSSENSEPEEEHVATDEQRWLYQSKCIVFTENLEELFYLITCSKCGSYTSVIDEYVSGSLVGAKLYCPNYHLVLDWKSQPVVKKVGVGNILLASAILFSGNTFSRVHQFAKFVGLHFIGSSTFYTMQRKLLNPVIDHSFRLQQDEVISNLPDTGVRLSGDGRCDSPGYSAKYCTYSMMDMEDNKIVSSNVVQVTETTSSVAMEKVGFLRCMADLQHQGIKVNVVATDRHTGIRATMKKDFASIDHQFDVWHLAKSVKKKILSKARSSECADLLPWLQAISNHLWWSAQSCGGDADLLVEMWTSLTYHITNVHEWVVGEKFRKCAHPPLTDQEIRTKAWLEPDSPAHKVLTEVLFDRRLLADVRFLNLACHTGQLEVFHGAMLKYCPKRQHFDMPQMCARTQLAILDHNSNTSREHAVVTHQTKGSAKKGHKRYKLYYSKGTKKWTVAPIYEAKSYDFVFTLMENTLSFKLGNLTLDEPQSSDTLPANIAPTEAPQKEEAVRMFQSRFSNQP